MSKSFVNQNYIEQQLLHYMPLPVLSSHESFSIQLRSSDGTKTNWLDVDGLCVIEIEAALTAMAKRKDGAA